MIAFVAFGSATFLVIVRPERWARLAFARGFRADWVLHPPHNLLIGATMVCFIAMIVAAKAAQALAKSSEVNVSHGSARLSTIREVRAKGNGRGGAVLCMEANAELEERLGASGKPEWKILRRAPMVCTPHYHVFIEGPTGAGKGISAIEPTLLNDPLRSHVVLDPKGANWEKTAGFLSAFGHAARFAPTERVTVRINPLLSVPIGNSREVIEAERIAQVLCGAVKDERDSSYFYSENAQPLLTAAFLHVLHNREGRDRSLPGANRLLLQQADLANILDQIRTGLPASAESLGGVLYGMGRDSRALQNVFTTCRNALKFCRLDLVADALSGTRADSNLIEPEDLSWGRVPLHLYLVLPFRDSDILRPLTRMLLNLLLSSHHKLNPRQQACYVLDEFPSIGLVPALLRGIRELREYGVQLVLAAQSESDVYGTYGDEDGKSIIANCRARTFLSLAGQENLENLSAILGKATFVSDRHTQAVSRRGFLQSTVTDTRGVGQHARELFTPDELRAMPEDSAVVVLPGLRPYIGKRPVRYAHPEFRRRASIPAPPGHGLRAAS
jgi:type IV secretory pathway TraG/TraD family ATPase VirD4